EAGVAEKMAEVLEAVGSAWRELAQEDPVNAQYVIPLAFRKRFLMKMNFREAYQFVRLRSRVQGHESYRRVAWAVKDEITRVHPELGVLMPCDYEGSGREAAGDVAEGTTEGAAETAAEVGA
ncbi:MAG: FAD-dependent thymidylate synthase, partial [Candidatus Eisenbacteria sp.]|nr:FAD-dependent thymidylate synthase [Candidatus Eisenbacteria bacterium]